MVPSNRINECYKQVSSFKVFYLYNKEEPFLYANCFNWEIVTSGVFLAKQNILSITLLKWLISLAVLTSGLLISPSLNLIRIGRRNGRKIKLINIDFFAEKNIYEVNN